MSTDVVKVDIDAFQQAWQYASQRDGWLSKREALALYGAATMVPAHGLIVEIGAFCGRSTALLAKTGRQVITIDPLIMGADVGRGVHVDESTLQSLTTVERENDNVTWLRMKSEVLSLIDIPGPIHLLYIDGNHVSDSAWRDFMHFREKLHDYALVAFHDYGSEENQSVTYSVQRAEAHCWLRCVNISGSLWTGVYTPEMAATANAKANIYVGMPHCNDIEPEAHDSVRDCLRGHEAKYRANVQRKGFSLLATNFNRLIAEAFNVGAYQFVAIHHSDIKAPAGWLGVMVDEMQRVGADVMHAPAAIKNSDGFTSTALAYSRDRWTKVRKLTTTELQKLPATFRLEDVNTCLRTDAERLLPNTGVLVMRAGDAFSNFPGFSILDRMVFRAGEWKAECVPEDWNFGHWCADSDIEVWGTKKVETDHWGRQRYSTSAKWGLESDVTWQHP